MSVAADINAKTYAIDAAKRAVHDHIFDTEGIEVQVESTRAFPTIFEIKYPINGEPKISIIIPNKDHVKDLRRCVDSVLKESTYKNFEININGFQVGIARTDIVFPGWSSFLKIHIALAREISKVRKPAWPRL